MIDQPILFRNQKNISKIVLNRSHKRNAISRELLNALQKVLLQLRDDSSVSCLLLTGSGEKAFCAGADLQERASMSEEEVVAFLDQFRETLDILENLPFPVVAALNGSAFGGGLEIALACDLRIARERASFGLTEAKLGIIPGAGGTQRLSRLVGVAKAKELIFLGKRLPGKAALAYGLVNQCFSDAEYEEKLAQLVEELMSSAPLSLKFAKTAIDRGLTMNLSAALDLERQLYNKTLTTKDRLEGLLAFREKRKPVFKGE
ncbi:MAG: enoyl-CoA hydratase-related protein [Spirochaetota bacterium]